MISTYEIYDYLAIKRGLLRQGVTRHPTGPVQIEVEYHVLPDAPSMQALNYGVLDALSGTVYEDDRQVIRFAAERFESSGKERIEITIIGD